VSPGVPALVLAAAAYVLRARSLARRGRTVRAVRAAAFALGLTLVLAALVSPLPRLGEERSFAAHMTEHLLLGDLGPILVVLGLSGPLLRPLLSLPGGGRFRRLVHPAVAVPLWVANLYAWHAPRLFDAALRHGEVHALQHACFFAAGVLAWAALFEPLPGPSWFGSGWKALVVLAMGGAGMALANVFIWSGHVLYARYESVADQRLGGAIMLVEGTAVTLAAFAFFFLRWMEEAEASQRHGEVGADPTSLARAVRHGRFAQK
jgi:putative membrane protein